MVLYGQVYCTLICNENVIKGASSIELDVEIIFIVFFRKITVFLNKETFIKIIKLMKNFCRFLTKSNLFDSLNREDLTLFIKR